MTHDVIDVRATAPREGGDQRPLAEPGSAEGSGELTSHLLRLSLDLQLDAMLLTLGAAAAQDPVDAQTPPAAPEADLPWRRWLDEDLESTRWLTATALALDSALPSTLGAQPAEEGPLDVAQHLLARYEAMCGLLTDLIVRVEGVPVGWRAHVQHALQRCRQRSDELQRHVEAFTRAARPEGARDRSGSWAVTSRDRNTRFLPGELLG